MDSIILMLALIATYLAAEEFVKLRHTNKVERLFTALIACALWALFHHFTH